MIREAIRRWPRWLRWAALLVLCLAPVLACWLARPFWPPEVVVEVDPGSGEVWVGDRRLWTSKGDSSTLQRARARQESWMEAREIRGTPERIRIPVHRGGASFWSGYLGQVTRGWWGPFRTVTEGGFIVTEGPGGCFAEAQFSPGHWESDLCVFHAAKGRLDCRYAWKGSGVIATVRWVPGEGK